MQTDEFRDVDEGEDQYEDNTGDQELYEDTFEDVEETAPVVQDFEQPDLSSLPMDMSFRLHGLTMEFSEVSALAPGSIMDVGMDLEAPIGIEVNGRQIGTGNLIKVGDRIGVQITRWIGPDALGGS